MKCRCSPNRAKKEFEVIREGEVIGTYRFCPDCGPEITTGRHALAALAEREADAYFNHYWKEDL